MQHLTLMTRFLLIEEADGYVELKDTAVTEFIDKSVAKNGIGNYSYEKNKVAINCMKNLDLFYQIFKNDTMIDANSGIKELSKEYLILSFYMLIRHLNKHYVIGVEQKKTIKDFLLVFYERWSKGDQEDFDIVVFSNNRQQSQNNLQERDIILRQLFFNFLAKSKIKFIMRDSNRFFNEAEKIKIYRRDKGVCQECIKENKSEQEAQISWSEYQADHIFPHAKGGQTVISNAQLLCRYHNVRKSAKVLTK